MVMFDNLKFKEWISWRLVRAHMCTFAACMSFPCTWRAPRDALRFGGASYGLLVTIAAVVVALPVALMQLALGQLSQQDAVGVWRAVPFFKGVGYLRLFTSFLGSIYTVIYVALSVAYFLYTSNNSSPFSGCVLNETEIIYLDAAACLSETFMAPISERPEYYISVSLIIIVLWVSFPFVLYSPAKMMKRIFYVLSPLVLLLAIAVLSIIGDRNNFAMLQQASDWQNLLQPDIWHAALVQALWASQVAGGYLISVGDTVYSNTNVQWTSLAMVISNVVASWASLLFWFGVSDPESRDTGPLAILVQAYALAIDEELNIAWPLLVFATMFLSGLITMIMLLYPLYERFRRVGGYKWRMLCVASSVLGAATALALLAGRVPALTALDDVGVPLLLCLTTVLEIIPFVFIYGCKVLVEDVEFLTESELVKYWVWGWHAAPVIILGFTLWWMTALATNDAGWTDPPWETSTLVATLATALVAFVVLAAVSVARQVQFDLISKFKSSFKPSRHWGPRDPITHYYWLARREEAERGNLPRTRYQRRFLGQFSGSPSFLNLSVERRPSKDFQLPHDVTRRTNSDDWMFTGYRRKYLEEIMKQYLGNKKRSKSLDWTVPSAMIKNRESASVGDLDFSYYVTPVESRNSVQEENNNVDSTKNSNNDGR